VSPTRGEFVSDPNPPERRPLDVDGPVGSVFRSLRRLVDGLYSGSRESQRSRGITAAQHFVLFQLHLRPNSSINALADLTMTHQSTVSVVVRRLVGKKLVRKRRSPNDARRVELTLTSAGRRVLERAPEPFQVRLKHALERLDLSDQVALADGLSRLLADMGAEDAPARMFFEPDEP
jgi:DNA-binding MarR family transcriptional regulator